jgi:hypothetical protein
MYLKYLNWFKFEFSRGKVCSSVVIVGWFVDALVGLNRFLAPAKPTTTIRTDGGWWAAAAVGSGRGGGRCSNAPSLIGDLDGTAAAAYATDGRSSLLGGYYYCGGVRGRGGRVLEQRAWEVRFLPGFLVCFAVIPM